jgi:hypothetical protein
MPPRGSVSDPEWPLRRLTFMLDRLGDACFVVIAYLVGASLRNTQA